MAGEETKGDAQPQGQTPPEISSDAEAQQELGKMALMDDEAKADESTKGEDAEAKPEEAEAAEEQAEEDAGEETESDGKSEEEGQEATEAHDSPRVEKRIAKLTAQREEMRERYEAAEAKAKELEQQVVQPIGLHPDYLSPDERKLIAEANSLDERRAFLIRHIGRGYDDPKDAARSMTAEQIAEELVLVERQTGRIGRAQALYDERKQQMLDDMRAGRQLRLSKAKLAKPAAPKPVAPASRPAAAASKPVASKPQRQGVDLDRFEKNGGDKDAAIRELAEMVQ